MSRPIATLAALALAGCMTTPTPDKAVTDQATVVVTWRDADGAETTLDWYMGCRQPGLAENAERLYEAWQELPLDDLVGTMEDRFRYEQDQAAGN